MKKILNLMTAIIFLAGVMAFLPSNAFSHVNVKKSSEKRVAPQKHRSVRKKSPPKKTAKPILSEVELKKLLIQKLSRSFPREELETIFSDERLKLDQSIFAPFYPKCTLPDGTERDHKGYFDRDCGILTESSLRRGKKFIEKYQEYLDGSFEKYGVEPEAVAAILRLETNFGSYTGTRSVLNTLYTRYVLDARRRNEALIQIEFFLRIKGVKSNDLFDLLGSSWGAFGLPQFMPYSYWHFAVDVNADGKIDLFDPADAIASAASYLREHGWSEKIKDRRNAIWAYNRDDLYVKAVLSYADALKKFEDSEAVPSAVDGDKIEPVPKTEEKM